MASERRIARLCSLIKQRVAEVLQRDMKDPRLGLVTITGVDLDRELTICKVYWSVLGDEKVRRRNAHALAHARKYVQREVAEILPTRTVPQLRFVFDESIEGTIRLQKLIEELRPNDEAAAGEVDPDRNGDDPA